MPPAYTGADDTVGLKGTDRSNTGSVGRFYLFRIYRIMVLFLPNAAFSILERTFGVFFLVLERVALYLFLLGTHGCYNSYFHNSTLFMAANVRILSEYIVSLQR